MTAVRTAPRPSPPRADRGSATLELTVLFPVVLLLVFGIIQGALWYHARNVALAAATEGLESARVATGTSSTGQNAASAFVAAAGGSDVLVEVNISTSRTPTQASVTVTGQSISVIPGLPGPPVSQTVTGPVERFTSGVTP